VDNAFFSALIDILSGLQEAELQALFPPPIVLTFKGPGHHSWIQIKGCEGVLLWAASKGEMGIWDSGVQKGCEVFEPLIRKTLTEIVTRRKEALRAQQAAENLPASEREKRTQEQRGPLINQTAQLLGLKV